MAQESFLLNTDNFLVLFIVFECGSIFESAVDKQTVKCNLQLPLNYFSVNVYVLSIVI